MRRMSRVSRVSRVSRANPNHNPNPSHLAFALLVGTLLRSLSIGLLPLAPRLLQILPRLLTRSL